MFKKLEENKIFSSLFLVFLFIIIFRPFPEDFSNIQRIMPITPNKKILRTEDYALSLGKQTIAKGNNVACSGMYVYDSATTSKKLWYITPNPWAISSAYGCIITNYTGNREFMINVNLRNIKGSFGGYPEIIYGRSPWSHILANGQSPKFPIQINEMEELIVNVDYKLSIIHMSGNVAFDLWLTNIKEPKNPYGGVEIMIWLWRNFQNPAGIYKGAINIPIKIDGNDTIRTFKVYIGKGNWDIVSFLIDDEQMIQSGSVEINILNFIEYTLLKLNRTNGLYLQGIEFGTEFTNDWQIYTFVLNKFDIRQTLKFFGDI